MRNVIGPLLASCNSDYEDLRVQLNSGSYDCSFERHIKIVGIDETYLGRKRGFADCLNEAGTDAKASYELKRQAEAFIGEGDYAAAAKCYSKIAGLYKKHAEIEKMITYYRIGINIASNAAVEEYRPILISYYYAKSREFLELADKSFDLLEEYPNQASATMHTTILNALIESDPSYGSSKPSKTLRELLRRTAIASLKRLDDEGADHTVVKSDSVQTGSVAISGPPSSII